MLLAIDVGNTNMVFGLFEGEELRGSFRISTNASSTSDEIGMMILQYYHFKGYKPEDTTAVIIASVVPPVMYSLTNAIRKYFSLKPMIVGTDVPTGIVNHYANPREVGVDRLVNAVSAIEKYGTPLIIVDIGTAITFDCIDKDGAYLGGAIFPGIKIAMEALFMKASKLPRVDIARTEKAIGRTTVQSMQSGAVRGYVGALTGIILDMQKELEGKLPRVDIARTEKAIGRTTVQSMQSGAVRGYVGALTGIILDMQKELEGDARVVATGGMGRMMAEHCGLIDDVDPNLTMDGLRRIYENNREVFKNRRIAENGAVEATEEG